MDGSGIEESQSEQHEDNQTARTDHGWRKGRTYKDTGSASRYSRAKRDDFDKLIEDLRAGGVLAPGDVLVLWESSRGSREQAEWAVFLNLVRDKDVLLYITSHHRLYDMSVPRDRRTMDEDGVDSAYESAKTSMRIRRHAAASAAKGRPHGRVQYGYRRVYSEDTGRLLKQVPHPQEAPVIKELFARLAQRQSLNSIAKDFAQCGITNHSGRPFVPAHLRHFALNPSYTGLRVHDPNRDRKHQNTLSPAATTVEAQWEALVDRRTFYAVQEFLSAPERRTSRPGRGVHLLSMIARCAVCGGPLAVVFRNERDRGGKKVVRTYRHPDPAVRAMPSIPRGSYQEYRCHSKSCVSVSKVGLDALAEATILRVLGSDELYTVLASTQDKDAEQGR